MLSGEKKAAHPELPTVTCSPGPVWLAQGAHSYSSGHAQCADNQGHTGQREGDNPSGDRGCLGQAGRRPSRACPPQEVARLRPCPWAWAALCGLDVSSSGCSGAALPVPRHVPDKVAHTRVAVLFKGHVRGFRARLPGEGIT